MSNFNEFFKKRSNLHGWLGGDYTLEFTDEEIANIDFLVFWEDHGDQHVTIKTKDNRFTKYFVCDGRYRLDRDRKGIDTEETSYISEEDMCGSYSGGYKVFYNKNGEVQYGGKVYDLVHTYEEDMDDDEYGVRTYHYDLKDIGRKEKCKFCKSEGEILKMHRMKVYMESAWDYKDYYICDECLKQFED